MKYKTKKQRIGAMLDTYRRLFKKTMFTTDEVAAWAVKVSLSLSYFLAVSTAGLYCGSIGPFWH